MRYQETMRSIPALQELADRADYVHGITVASGQTLREFAAACLSYMPGWMRLLYGIRKHFVRLLGTTQEDIPRKTVIRPEELSFTPGEMGAFFTILDGEEEWYWIGEARDEMIAGCVAFVREPGPNGRNRFHMITTAHFLRRTGRFYFNVIRPFHHVVVRAMLRHALAGEVTQG